jgi:hypothetical protein
MAASENSVDSNNLGGLGRRMSVRPPDRFYNRVEKIINKFESSKSEIPPDIMRETDSRKKLLKHADKDLHSYSSRSILAPPNVKSITSPPVIPDMDSAKAREYISAYIESTPFLQTIPQIKEADRVLHSRVTNLINQLGNLVTLLDYNFEIVDSLPTEYLLHSLLQNIVFPDKGALTELMDKLRAKSRLSCAVCGCSCARMSPMKQENSSKNVSRSPIKAYKKEPEEFKEESKVYVIDMVNLNQNRQCSKCSNFYLTAKKDDQFVCRLCEQGCVSSIQPKQISFTLSIHPAKSSYSGLKSFSSSSLKSKNPRLQDYKEARLTSEVELMLEMDCINKIYSLSGNSSYICKFILPKNVMNIALPDDRASVSPNLQRRAILFKSSPSRKLIPDPIEYRDDDRLRSYMSSRSTITGYLPEAPGFKPFDTKLAHNNYKKDPPKQTKTLEKMHDILNSDPSLPCYQVMIQTKAIKEKGMLLHKELSNLLEEHLGLYEDHYQNPDTISATTEKIIGDYSRILRNLLRGTINFLPEHACGFEKCYKGLVLIIDKLLNMMGSYRQQIRDQEDYESKILQSEHQYKLKFEELEKEITIMKKGYEERINKLQRIIKNNRDIIELYRAELESQEARGEGIEGIITSEVSKDGVIKTLITNIGAKKSALIENRLEK